MRAQHQSPASLHCPTGRRKYLNADERVRFIAAAMEHPRLELRTFCLVLAFTGCRISEALGLIAASVEPSEGVVTIRCLKKRRKTAVIRQVPVPPDLLRILSDVHDLTVPDARLWTWSRSRAWQLVKAVMTQAGIAPGVHKTPKGLRHGFGVCAIRNHVPLHLVQRWMGHARMETTAIYLNVIGPEERAIAARMWDHTSQSQHA